MRAIVTELPQVIRIERVSLQLLAHAFMFFSDLLLSFNSYTTYSHHQHHHPRAPILLLYTRCCLLFTFLLFATCVSIIGMRRAGLALSLHALRTRSKLWAGKMISLRLGLLCHWFIFLFFSLIRLLYSLTFELAPHNGPECLENDKNRFLI